MKKEIPTSELRLVKSKIWPKSYVMQQKWAITDGTETVYEWRPIPHAKEE